MIEEYIRENEWEHSRYLCIRKILTNDKVRLKFCSLKVIYLRFFSIFSEFWGKIHFRSTFTFTNNVDNFLLKCFSENKECSLKTFSSACFNCSQWKCQWHPLFSCFALWVLTYLSWDPNVSLASVKRFGNLISKWRRY